MSDIPDWVKHATTDVISLQYPPDHDPANWQAYADKIEQIIYAYSIAAQPPEAVAISLELADDLLQVCTWYKSACALARAGETYDTCPDKDPFNYLESEAESIGERLAAAVQKAKH